MENQDENVLYTFDKSNTEQVRIRETTFKGKEYIDIRIYAQNQMHEYIPTKKGVMLSREKMQELKKALNDLIG
jgi:hypothetical protein